MNLTINVPDDLLLELRRRAELEDRSVSRHIISLIRKDLAPSALVNQSVPPKLSKQDEYELKRPFRKHLVTVRGFDAAYLTGLKRDAEYQIYLDYLKPGTDGTLNGSSPMSYEERIMDLAAFNAATGQNPSVGKQPSNPFAVE